MPCSSTTCIEVTNLQIWGQRSLISSSQPSPLRACVCGCSWGEVGVLHSLRWSLFSDPSMTSPVLVALPLPSHFIITWSELLQLLWPVLATPWNFLLCLIATVTMKRFKYIKSHWPSQILSSQKTLLESLQVSPTENYRQQAISRVPTRKYNISLVLNEGTS